MLLEHFTVNFSCFGVFTENSPQTSNVANLRQRIQNLSSVVGYKCICSSFLTGMQPLIVAVTESVTLSQN